MVAKCNLDQWIAMMYEITSNNSGNFPTATYSDKSMYWYFPMLYMYSIFRTMQLSIVLPGIVLLLHFVHWAFQLLTSSTIAKCASLILTFNTREWYFKKCRPMDMLNSLFPLIKKLYVYYDNFLHWYSYPSK